MGGLWTEGKINMCHLPIKKLKAKNKKVHLWPQEVLMVAGGGSVQSVVGGLWIEI